MSESDREFIPVSRELSVFGVPVEVAFRPLRDVDSKTLDLMKKVLERDVPAKLAPPLPPSRSPFADLGLSMEDVIRIFGRPIQETYSHLCRLPFPTRVPDEK